MSKSFPLAHEQRSVANELDSIWDENAEKYKCCCRTVHVKRASLFIGYTHMFLIFILAIFILYTYIQVLMISGSVTSGHWNDWSERFIASFLVATLLQLLITLLLIRGIQTERRSYLFPFIVFVSMAILIGFAQLAHDFFSLFRVHQTIPYDNRQIFAHLIGTLINMWCVVVVWRCYGFLGDKKVARQISDQLSTTHLAFHYGDIPYGYIAMPQPPPYADTVITVDKQPLNSA